jgi:hypothetical protein
MSGGFNFKRLLELHPSKADNLASLREHVKSTAATIRELKVRFCVYRVVRLRARVKRVSKCRCMGGWDCGNGVCG